MVIIDNEPLAEVSYVCVRCFALFELFIMTFTVRCTVFMFLVAPLSYLLSLKAAILGVFVNYSFVLCVGLTPAITNGGRLLLVDMEECA